MFFRIFKTDLSVLIEKVYSLPHQTCRHAI